MNSLEEIQKWYIRQLEKGDRHQTYLDKIDWLIAEIHKAKPVVYAAIEYVGEKNQGAYGEIVQDLYRELDKAVKAMEE